MNDKDIKVGEMVWELILLEKSEDEFGSNDIFHSEALDLFTIQVDFKGEKVIYEDETIDELEENVEGFFNGFDEILETIIDVRNINLPSKEK